MDGLDSAFNRLAGMERKNVQFKRAKKMIGEMYELLDDVRDIVEDTEAR